MKRKLLWGICMIMLASLFVSCQKETNVENYSSHLMSAPSGAPVKTLDTLAFMQKMHNDAMAYLYDALETEAANGCSEITQDMVKTHLLAFAQSYNYSTLKGGGNMTYNPSVSVKAAIESRLVQAFESAELTAQSAYSTTKIVVLPASIQLNAMQASVKSRVERAILLSSNHAGIKTRGESLLAEANAVTSGTPQELATAFLLKYSAGTLLASNQYWDQSTLAWENVFYEIMPATKGKRTGWKSVGRVVAADAVGAIIGFLAGGLWGSIGTAIAFSAAAAATEVTTNN